MRAGWVAVACLVSLQACQSGLDVELPALPINRTSDEQQISGILSDVQAGMQTKRIYKVLAHVSRGYKDAEGRDYNGLREYLSEIFRSYRVIKITRTNPRVVVEGDQARAIETFGTIAEPLELAGAPPINLQGRVSVYFERVMNRWMIVEWGTIQ